MKPRGLVVAAYAACLFLAGCKPPNAAHTFLGMTKETDWPYRYWLTETNGVWSGTVEHLDAGGWAFSDTMEITEQGADKINFKAQYGPFKPGWYLTLKDVSPQGFSAMLVGDVFDSRAVTLTFATAADGSRAAAAGSRR